MLVKDYEIRLSIQRALLDKVTPNLRQISYAFENDLIKLYFFYDSIPSEEEKELSEDVSAEVIADFPGPYMVECTLQDMAYPAIIKTTGYTVYSRYEHL